MTISEVLGILSLYTGILTAVLIIALRWGKVKMDEQSTDVKVLSDKVVNTNIELRRDHSALSHLIAKDYMDKDNTMQMYSLMSQATEQKVDAVFKKVDEMSKQMNEMISIMAAKS